MRKIIFIYFISICFFSAFCYEVEKYYPVLKKDFSIPWIEYNEDTLRFGLYQHLSDKAGLLSESFKYLYNERSEKFNFEWKNNKKNRLNSINQGLDYKHSREKYLGKYYIPERINVFRKYAFQRRQFFTEISFDYSHLEYYTTFPMFEGDIFRLDMRKIFFFRKELKRYNRIINNIDYNLAELHIVNGDFDYLRYNVRTARNIFQRDFLTFRINLGYEKLASLDRNMVNILLKNGSGGLHLRGFGTEIYAKELFFRNAELIFPLFEDYKRKFWKFYSISLTNRIFADSAKFTLDNFEKTYSTYGNEIIIRTIFLGKIPLNIVLSFYKDENRKSDHYSYFYLDIK